MTLLIFFALGVTAGFFVKREFKIEKILNVTLVVLVFAMGVRAGQVEVRSWKLLIVPIALMLAATSTSVLMGLVVVKFFGRR